MAVNGTVDKSTCCYFYAPGDAEAVIIDEAYCNRECTKVEEKGSVYDFYCSLFKSVKHNCISLLSTVVIKTLAKVVKVGPERDNTEGAREKPYEEPEEPW